LDVCFPGASRTFALGEWEHVPLIVYLVAHAEYKIPRRPLTVDRLRAHMESEASPLDFSSVSPHSMSSAARQRAKDAGGFAGAPYDGTAEICFDDLGRFPGRVRV
jgi:hypothetical protein